MDPGAVQGCYIAIPTKMQGSDMMSYPSWTFGTTSLDEGDADYPDLALDDTDGSLSLINISTIPRTYYVTISECSSVILGDGSDAMKDCMDTVGHDYVTFISLVFPLQSLRLCKLVPRRMGKRSLRARLSTVRITSDIQDYSQTETLLTPFNIETFPLIGNGFMCTQANGGHLTHFAHTSTYHAVDFRCPVGTSVVAPFDATVVDIRNDSSNSGVRVEDLFSWNSVMLKSINSELFCEFVHIKKDSFKIKIGDTVKQGEVICESGNVGFCPEPHLHMELHTSAEPGSDSIPLLFRGLPFQVGQLYP